jgi:hypothetical protein
MRSRSILEPINTMMNKYHLKSSNLMPNVFDYLTNKKIHHIDCKLYVGSFNEDEFLFLYPEAMNSIIYEVWNFIGNYEPLSITLSYE